MEQILIDYCPHINQEKVHNSSARFRVLVAGRRFGKTTIAVNELIKYALLNDNSLSFYVAPTYRQAKMIAFNMLKKYAPEEAIDKVNESDLMFKFKNGAAIALKGADNEDSLRGVGITFLVVDEVDVIPDARRVWGEVLRPMLTDTKGRALFIGTPKGQLFLYDMYQQGLNKDSDVDSFMFHTVDNPFIDPDEVEEARKELPKTMFDQEYECSFVTDEERTLITSKMLADLKGIEVLWNGKQEVVAVDPAMGGDECVIYAMRNYKVVDEMILHERDTMKITGEIAIFANRFDINDICIDVIGLGQGIYDRLRELKFNVIAINSSERANEPERFYNLRAEMWWYVMQLIRDKKIEAIESLELRRQLNAVRYEVINSNGQVKLVPKQKTKEILGRSPDRADTFIYGCWATQEVKPKKVRDRWQKHREIYDEQEFNLMG